MTTLQTRLNDAGWTLHCQRYIDLVAGEDDGPQARTCTWKAVKGEQELVVRSQLGKEGDALRYLYDVAKTIDPDLQQIAMESGSGGWVFDLSKEDMKSE